MACSQISIERARNSGIHLDDVADICLDGWEERVLPSLPLERPSKRQNIVLGSDIFPSKNHIPNVPRKIAPDAPHPHLPFLSTILPSPKAWKGLPSPS